MVCWMTDSRTSHTNQAFEAGIARIEQALFRKFRQDTKKKNIEVTNLNVDRIQAEYNLKSGQVRTLPTLIKSIMERMILDDSLEDVLPEHYKGFALGSYNHFNLI